MLLFLATGFLPGPLHVHAYCTYLYCDDDEIMIYCAALVKRIPKNVPTHLHLQQLDMWMRNLKTTVEQEHECIFMALRTDF